MSLKVEGIALVALTILLMCYPSCAQDSSVDISPVVSGVLEVSDQINTLGEVNTSMIGDILYESTDTVIWKVTPSMDPAAFYLTGMDFYAMLNKKEGTLSILIDADNESMALRGMMPSLYGYEEYAMSENPDPAHYCYEYNQTKTLIHYVLRDAFSSLKASNAVNQIATLNMTQIMPAASPESAYWAYIAALSRQQLQLFLQLALGDGNDVCKYHPEFHGCEYPTAG